MSLQPRPGAEIPALTVRVARASNPHGTAAMWIRDRLDGLFSDEDFTAWYPCDGRPWALARAAGHRLRAAVGVPPVLLQD
ncbi:hypothetical protein ACWD6P_09330 [Streptomyces sp. NPDC002446]